MFSQSFCFRKACRFQKTNVVIAQTDKTKKNYRRIGLNLRYRRIGYNLNVMRQSASLVFNPIMVDNYAAFFNCTPVGRASDSMMAPF